MLKAIELFAGCGGLALGLEKAGFNHVALYENNKEACNTLRKNKIENVFEEDVSKVDFSKFRSLNIDLLSGGFPCQAFSHAGKRLGFGDVRGTMFYEFARAIKEIQPRVFLGENVKGLLTHDKGNTLKTILEILREDLGYFVVEPFVLNAMNFSVAQKRERLIIIGFKNKKDFLNYQKPEKHQKIISLKECLKDVPDSEGMLYSKKKEELFKLLKAGENWKNLPKKEKEEYMGKMLFAEGGKTGILKKLSWDEPSVTLLCSPSQKQTERCHPEENRPLKIREYARIQSFPDSWEFCGSKSSQYKQIGNAVPVNLAYSVGESIKKVLFF